MREETSRVERAVGGKATATTRDAAWPGLYDAAACCLFKSVCFRLVWAVEKVRGGEEVDHAPAKSSHDDEAKPHACLRVKPIHTHTLLNSPQATRAATSGGRGGSWSASSSSSKRQQQPRQQQAAVSSTWRGVSRPIATRTLQRSAHTINQGQA